MIHHHTLKRALVRALPLRAVPLLAHALACGIAFGAVVASPLHAQFGAFGQNKIYWNNFNSLIQTAIRIGLTVLLFALAANIFNAGIAIFVAASAGVLMSMFSAWLNARGIRMFRPSFHREELRSLSRTSSHVLLM